MIRYALLLVFLVVVTAAAVEPERQLPFAVLSSRGDQAMLTDFEPPRFRGAVGTMLTVRNPAGEVVLRDQDSLEIGRAVDAAWTTAGDYLVILFVNGAGHSPWRYSVAVFSRANAQVSYLRPKSFTEFVSPKLIMGPANTVRLVVGTYDQDQLPADAAEHGEEQTFDLSPPTEPQT